MRFKSYIDSVSQLIELIDSMQCVEKETTHTIGLLKSVSVDDLKSMIAKNQQILEQTHENRFKAQEELASKLKTLCLILIDFGFLPRDFTLQKL